MYDLKVQNRKQCLKRFADNLKEVKGYYYLQKRKGSRGSRIVNNNLIVNKLEIVIIKEIYKMFKETYKC